MALAGGGAYVTGALSGHSVTNVETIGKFLEVRFEVTELGQGKWRVDVSAAR
jgi:RNA 3'-terminal phosphate cyclase